MRRSKKAMEQEPQDRRFIEGSISGAELMGIDFETPKKTARRARRPLRARIDFATMTFDIEEWDSRSRKYCDIYYYDLHRLVTAAGFLDFLLQVHGKTWATPQLIADILEELQYVMRWSAQGYFCPSGRTPAHSVDWQEVKEKRK